MARKLLIAGCSQAAGHEINGEMDCAYNRQHSFGNLLADKLDRQAVNIGMGSLCNAGITRSVLTWFDQAYNPADDVAVLVAWSEACRMEMPQDPEMNYNNPATDYYVTSHRDFVQVNITLEAREDMGDTEQRNIRSAQRFMVEQQTFCEILTMQNIMLLQNYFKAHGIDYAMCSTMDLYRDSKWVQHYIPFVDTINTFMDFHNPDAWFYWYYRNAGYENPLAKYWHHDEKPHALYAEKLYAFCEKTGSLLKSG